MSTDAQDLIDPFTPRIEELLRERDAARGVGRPVVVLICDLFIYLMQLMKGIAERKRAGEVAATAEAVAPDQVDINEPIAAAAREVSPGEEAGVERSAKLPLPRRVRARKLKVSTGQAAARRRHVDHGFWPQWRGVGVVWTPEVEFLGVDSTKWGLGAGIGAFISLRFSNHGWLLLRVAGYYGCGIARARFR